MRNMLDNWSVAVLSRVNDLADRYGIKPYEFTAVLGIKDATHSETEYVLRFEDCHSGKEFQYDKMLRAVGLSFDGDSELWGQEAILNALDTALRQAPQQRGR